MSVLKNLHKDYNPIVILAESGLLCEELNNHKIEYHVIPLAKLFSSSFSINFIINLPYSIYSSLKAITKIINDRKIDLVYTNTLSIFIGGIWAKLNNAYHIWHVREIITDSKILQIICSIYLQVFSDKIICNSEATRKRVIKYIKYLQKKTIVIHNGVETINVKNRIRGKQRTITLIGRINSWKGQSLFISAVNQLISQIPNKLNNISFLIVGSPYRTQEDLLHKLQSKINSISLNKYIKIVPYTKNIEDIYSISNIIVIPSAKPEPFGLVAIEGMSCSKAIIAANHGGLKEIVKHGKTGYLFNPNDLTDFTKYLKILILNKSKCDEFGKQGKIRFNKLFLVNQYSSKINEILSNIN